ncbi:MAG: alpha/beta hydrolase [Bacteroidales bacterium]
MRLLAVFSFVLLALSSTAQYKMDILGSPFESRTIVMQDDYEGAVKSTVIRLKSDSPKTKAILYVHGYNDYFFQKEMAYKFDSAGYQFYAVDLRKYGRSLLPNQKQFNVRDIAEYFNDIDSAIAVINNEGFEKPILMGHSTGGLITTLYADSRREQQRISALILNSPFFDQNQSWFMENILIPVVSFFAPIMPNVMIKQGVSIAYAESLLKSHRGEWDYDTSMKLIQSPPISTSWLRSIYKGQQRVHKGVDINVPTLVLRSDKSSNSANYDHLTSCSDVVLDVNDIQYYSEGLGENCEIEIVKDAIHDISLSSILVRNRFYQIIFKFLQ